MKKKEVISNLEYLVEKYVPDRWDLINLVIANPGGVKYVLAEIGKHKKREYDKQDIEIIKDIAFYYV